MDGKDALQRQLSAAKVGSSSGAGKEQSVLSLMMEVEDLKTKVTCDAVPARCNRDESDALWFCSCPRQRRRQQQEAEAQRRRRSTRS